MGLVPTQSVLHIVGFRTPPTTYFAASKVIEQLAKYIDNAFARDMFHLFNTCNVWTARVLRNAGLAVHDSITIEGLMAQTRRLGSVVQTAPFKESGF